eukprot:TRINITY_DN8542_c0_g1_i1.p1 TRINITY_DN8542_c0_g1~~TRINITY_DN8542_c0_g1_i1.p1  ORF type:complete len:323 (+),score=127.92 TRINITY_DN8542_c0_g1_i1:56-970(+)
MVCCLTVLAVGFVLFVIGIVAMERYRNKERKSLKGLRVLITGAGSGIGREMAVQFAQQGSRMILWDINREMAEETAAIIKEKTGNEESVETVLRVDVSNREEVFAIAAPLIEHQIIDIIINNAGVVSGKSITELTERDIRRTIDVNLLGPMWVTQAFLPSYLEINRGHIVTIASTCSLFAAVRLSDYCASKHGVFAFHDSLRLELRKLKKTGIKTTIVCPNAINTGMFKGIRLGLEWLVPILNPADVAQAVVNAVKAERRMIVIPRIVEYMEGIVRGLYPVWLKDLGMDVFGASTGMDAFEGRK